MEWQKLVKHAIGKWAQDNELTIEDKVMDKLVVALTSNNFPTSSKAAKIASRSYRREARAQLGGYQKTLEERLFQVNDILKKKPKWVHSKLWKFGASFFVDISKIEKPLSNNDTLEVA